MPRLDVDGRWGRMVQRVSGSPQFARVAPKVIPPVDRVLHRISGGRVLLSRGLIPGLVLTMTGRKSGQARDTPLMCVPEPEGTWLVLGSNFGRAHHPAWTGNLLAAPTASISYGAKDIPVEAELLEGDARDAAWTRANAVWPTFDRYAERAGREIRVFRLSPS